MLTQQGHLREAEKLQRETVATRRRVFGEQNMDTLRSMSNLVWTVDREGNYAGAENLERAVLDGQQRVFKPDNVDTAKTTNNLAATLGHEGHYAEAEKIKRDAQSPAPCSGTGTPGYFPVYEQSREYAA